MGLGARGWVAGRRGRYLNPQRLLEQPQPPALPLSFHRPTEGPERTFRLRSSQGISGAVSRDKGADRAQQRQRGSLGSGPGDAGSARRLQCGAAAGRWRRSSAQGAAPAGADPAPGSARGPSCSTDCASLSIDSCLPFYF